MRMDTRPASTAAARGTKDTFIEQLGADAELAEHSQKLSKTCHPVAHICTWQRGRDHEGTAGCQLGQEALTFLPLRSWWPGASEVSAVQQ